MNDIHNSGRSDHAAGIYRNIHISGSANIKGDIECESLHVSGSCKASGKIICPNGEVHISGSFRSEGDLSAKEFSISGSSETGGFEGGSFRCSGSAKVNGHIKCEEAVISGRFECKDDIDAENLSVSGRCNVSGMLCAENINISLDSDNDSSAASIGGSIIKIKPSVRRRLKKTIRIGNITINMHGNEGEVHVGGADDKDIYESDRLIASSAVFRTSSIEGDEIELENTVCEVVRGNKIRIGAGCRIGCVEYTESCEKDDNAEVTEVKKM